MDIKKASKFLRRYLLAPPKCMFCGSEDCTSSLPLCAGCFPKYAAAALEGCDICGAMPIDCRCFEVKNCAALYWLFNYRRPEIKELIIRMKRERLDYALRFLAARLVDQMLIKTNGAPPFDCVCFVPRSKRTELYYNHNHAEELAREVADLLHLPCARLLSHTGAAGEQKQLSRVFRGDAAKTRFKINEKALLNGKLTYRSPLLVDDVVTTGATAGECARLLKERGAKYVGLCFLAHTPPSRP